MTSNRRNFITKAGLGIGGVVGLSSGGDFSGLQIKDTTLNFVNVALKQIIGDGKTKNTLAINSLIKEIHENGGGTLYFPPGNYITGAIHLKSNITIHLEAGAVITFSTDFDDYLPMVQSRWQGIDCVNFSPLIYANNASNITIKGRGTFDGGGAVWWDFVLKLRKEFKETGKVDRTSWQEIFYQNNPEASDQSFGFMRPSLFQAYNSDNILIEGVRFLNSPFWTVHLVTCENVVVDRVWIHNEDSPNTDGINPESSRNVRISNCYIYASDDCITIKSGKSKWARENAKPCENITVTNCVMTSGAAGIGIGSEMSAGVRRVTVSNCVFENTHTGIHIKTNRERGGIVEDVVISNIVMNNVSNEAGIFINTEYWIKTSPGPVNENTPRFRNIHISNVTGVNLKKAVEIIGLEEMAIENVSLSNINTSSQYGLKCRHIKNLILTNIQVNDVTDTPFVFEHIEQADLDGLTTNAGKDQPKVKLLNVKDFSLGRCRHNGSGKAFLEIDGEFTRQVWIQDKRLLTSGAVVVTGKVKKGTVNI